MKQTCDLIWFRYVTLIHNHSLKTKESYYSFFTEPSLVFKIPRQNFSDHAPACSKYAPTLRPTALSCLFTSRSHHSVHGQVFKGCRMGRSDRISLWYVALLINTRFRSFILE